jgi:hypothetical protein
VLFGWNFHPLCIILEAAQAAKMSVDDPLYYVIEFIMNKATSAELEVITEALKRRTTDAKGFGGVSPRSMARNMAQSIQKQLGGSFDLGNIARKIVGDLIRHKEPGISNEQLEILLNKWLPGSARRQRAPGPEQAQNQETPPDVLVSRITTYLEAELGALDEREAGELPEGWKAQYWESFPPAVRSLIGQRLQGKIDEVTFWEQLVAVLQR